MSEHVTEDEITAILTDLAARANLHPAYVYAIARCGFMVTEMNLHLMDDDMLEEWETMIDVYMAGHPDAPPLD